MKEILGYNLTDFFNNFSEDLEDLISMSKMTYKGKTYEVWELDDDTFEYISDISEEEFEDKCADGWWIWSSGSVLDDPIEEFIINGKSINAFNRKEHNEYFHNDYPCLTEYMCSHVGASQPENVCVLAVDLAKINGMSMGELFTKYEG